MLVGYAGVTVPITDPETGEITRVQIFVTTTKSCGADPLRWAGSVEAAARHRSQLRRSTLTALANTYHSDQRATEPKSQQCIACL